ncbi:ribosomal RNA methyltransferase [Plasmodium gonderi]|uniref:Putative tRNA (cytidine(32)/guanosine(34)-2'-O)-methyltransferase n=1 Tax=Plasmodium gonderi TaxID=77519 RepID=A0A1Y1JC93_PLAGO|nr:ribosomal RNA methyltransferase [Plasmodium gonderi]GAW80151.1 ribosomal RNA methyltransferase [Plasmodium gonderi]
MGKLSKDRRDIYYRKAKENGYRARSSYKLIQINEKFEIFKLFDPENCDKNLNELIHMYNEQFCYNIVDLCAAPGSWSQVLKNICLYNYYQILHFVNKNHQNPTEYVEHENFISNFSLYVNFNDTLEKRINNLKKNEKIKKPKIIAVDLQEIGNMNYIKIIQGDITKTSTVQQILKCMNDGNDLNGKRTQVGHGGIDANSDDSNGFNNNQLSIMGKKGDKLNMHNKEYKATSTYAHAVVSDGAPDITGMNDIDEFIQSQLILSSLKVCCSVLKIGGNFISKIFRGEHTGLLILHLNKFFKRVYVCKPQSSRYKSLESFLVCLNFFMPPSNITPLSNHTEEKKIINQNITQERLRKLHVKLINEKDDEGKIRKNNKTLGRHTKSDGTSEEGICVKGENSNDESGYDNQTESDGYNMYDGENENNLEDINEYNTSNGDEMKNKLDCDERKNKLESDEGKNKLEIDERNSCDTSCSHNVIKKKTSNNSLKNKNIDIFNFYCSDSSEEIKYFNSDEEDAVNDYISSEVFMNEKLFSFVATQNYYDSDKSYLLPQNYVRHEPQLMPLQPPYMLSLQKKRQENKKVS